jgi:8-oxo-dGTP diphosphatase
MTTKKYPSMYLTADIVFLELANTQSPQILLIQRMNEPYKDCWALPGGFFDMADQNIKVAAQRELMEETGLKIPTEEFNFLGLYTEKNRDPREHNPQDPCRIAAAAFYVKSFNILQKIQAQDDAKAVQFFPIRNLPPLAFDHSQIIQDALAACKL